MDRLVHEEALTAEDLLGLPDTEERKEIVAGCLICEPPASYRHGEVAAQVFRLLVEFVRSRGLGKVLSAETGFVLARSPDTVRAPDVAFITNQRLKAAGVFEGFFPGPPDLAVEVRSPGDRQSEIHAKVADYLAGGARLVWVVEPARSCVWVYESLLSPRTLGPDELLEAPGLLPGFSVHVSEIFES